MSKPARKLWRDKEGLLEEVQTRGKYTSVVRSSGYSRPGSIACHLKDTGNGYVVKFPAHSSIEQDAYITLGYDDARNLILALTPHSKALGFYNE